MIRVLMTDIRALEENDVLFARGSSLVTARRRDKIFQCSQKKDRCRSLAAGLLLRRGFLDAGFCYERLRVTEGEHGKPGAPDAENKGFYYNLTHAGDYAVAAFASCPVGVDIDTADRLRNPKRMADRILTPYEKSHLEGLLAAETTIHGRIWPAESGHAVIEPFLYGKASGEHGLRTETTISAVEPDSGDSTSVRTGKEHGVRSENEFLAVEPDSGDSASVRTGKEHGVRSETAIPVADLGFGVFAYDRISEELLREWLVCVWTRKEACVKAMGTGLYSDFRTLGVLGHKAAARIESAEIFERVWLSVCAPGTMEAIGSISILAGEDLCTTN